MATQQKKIVLSTIVAIMLVVTTVLTFGFKSGEKSDQSLDPTYYWYKVNAAGQMVAGSEAYGGAPTTEDQAHENLPCTEGNVSDCVRGFTTQIVTFPSTAPGTVSIKKNN